MKIKVYPDSIIYLQDDAGKNIARLGIAGRDPSKDPMEYARLFAAAPDLLAACEAAYPVLIHFDFSTEASQLAAAIAKARGERPDADPGKADDPQTVRELLLLADVDVPIETISRWSLVQREAAADWAAAVHLAASDNDDVSVPDKPAFLD